MKKNVTDNKKHRRNNQIRKTQIDFIDALLNLLKQHNINEIRINDLVKKAGYSRRTFYRHFLSLEDILKIEVSDLVLKMFDVLNNLNDDTSFQDIVKTFFDYWKNKIDVLVILKKQKLFYLLQQCAFENIKYSKLAKMLSNEKNSIYVESFALSGMFALLEIWIENGYVQTTKEMEEVALIIKTKIN